jgi:hypothetical protein
VFIASSRLISTKSASVPDPPAVAVSTIDRPWTSCASAALAAASAGSASRIETAAVSVTSAARDRTRPEARVARDLDERDGAVDVDVEPAAAAVGEIDEARRRDRLRRAAVGRQAQWVRVALGVLDRGCGGRRRRRGPVRRGAPKSTNSPP